MASLKGKVSLITGASSGIGWATALEFARRGALVAVTGRDAGALAQLKSAVANQQLIIDGLEEKIRQEEKRRALFNRLAPVRRHTRTDTLLCTPACFFPLLPAPQHIAPSFCSQMSVSGLDTNGCRTSKAAPAPSCKDAGARRCVDDAGKGGGDGEKG